MLQSDWHKKDIKHKDGRLIRLCITSKLCLHSNLRTLRTVGTLAFADAAFQSST